MAELPDNVVRLSEFVKAEAPAKPPKKRRNWRDYRSSGGAARSDWELARIYLELRDHLLDGGSIH